ncbi:YifB family Mg chelatase-like AAA ATPase [Dactylosporangium maewongense]|uniref:YifB family Mg chelatase-like AAA ATPase n=1 Tax=Dactylosporangium maewongense TaxID=634393 RepID=A0ABN2CRU0_9ACTN
MTDSTTGRSPAVTVSTVTVAGDSTHLVDIHATLTSSGPAGTITGLHPDTAGTTRDRLYAAIHNAGLRWPAQHVAVEVAPTALPGTDTGLDAAVAVALLAVTGQIPTGGLRDAVVIGELGLDGSLRTPRAVAQRLTTAAGAGVPLALIPTGARDLAATVPDISVWLATHLRELVTQLHIADPASAPAIATVAGRPGWPSPGVPVADLADLPAGDWQARRVLEVAAAGAHHLAMIGPAAAATAFARCLPGLLPDLDDDTSRQVADLYRAAGLVPAQVTALRRPPWQAPHHTAPTAALIGTPARPGAVSLAHGGVLHLDNAAAYGSRAVEALGQPLDTELVRLASAAGTVTYPARTQLVVTTPDCPCADLNACTCSPARRRRHLHRLRPLLDRIEIRALLPSGPAQPPGRGEPSMVVAARVAAARTAAAARWAPHVAATNHDVPDAILQQSIARIRAADLAPLRDALAAGTVSTRGTTHILRLAWTLADLAALHRPGPYELTEAITLLGPAATESTEHR